MRVVAVIAILGGCRVATPHALSVELRSGGSAIDGAVVVVTCGPRTYAQRTDGRGHAVIAIGGDAAASCQVLAGRPGFKTIEAQPTHMCTTASCPPWMLALEQLEPPAVPPGPAASDPGTSP